MLATAADKNHIRDTVERLAGVPFKALSAFSPVDDDVDICPDLRGGLLRGGTKSTSMRGKLGSTRELTRRSPGLRQAIPS